MSVPPTPPNRRPTGNGQTTGQRRAILGLRLSQVYGVLLAVSVALGAKGLAGALLAWAIPVLLVAILLHLYLGSAPKLGPLAFLSPLEPGEYDNPQRALTGRFLATITWPVLVMAVYGSETVLAGGLWPLHLAQIVAVMVLFGSSK